MAETAKFGILGPLRVTNAGRPLKPGGPRQRALLAALLVRAGQPVGLGSLVEAVWGERPPASAVANVHTYVSRLRRDLAGIGLRDVLVTGSGGYRLLADPGALDSTCFQIRADQARAALAFGDPAEAVAVWEDAWTAWRGDPLEDVPGGGWLEAETARLDQLAAAAREDFADARLAAGQYAVLIPELAALVRRLPLREGLWERLMLAQHRAGHRAEALETYRTLRGVLVDALGVEPCEPVRELHQVILRGGFAGLGDAVGVAGVTGVSGVAGGMGVAGVAGGAGIANGVGVGRVSGVAGVSGVGRRGGRGGIAGAVGVAGGVEVAGRVGAAGGVAAAGLAGTAAGVAGTVSMAGSPGPAGVAGTVGTAAGVAGTVSMAGSPGPAGMAGPSSAVGVAGSAGAVSAACTEGAAGVVGAAAVTSPLGVAGNAGITGSTGIANTAGIANTSAIPATTGMVRPMQLPPDIEDFTGREAEAAELRRVLTRPVWAAPALPVVAAVTGKAGVGKTALAVRAAHQVSGYFDGGQLYVRLGGTGSAPPGPSAVLATLLVAFGVHPHAIPEDFEARAALYRSQLAARRVLIVLDDVASMAQVRPLLPGSAGSAVLVTSRVQLLAVHTVRLDVLGQAESVRLLATIAGPARMTAEPDAAAAVARYCGNLPLALRIAASRLARRGQWTVGRLAERLADEGTRLNELRIDDLEARASLAWSYEALDEVQQRAFRLLGLLDVPDFPAWAVAALLDVGLAEAEDIVDSLADVHLVEPAGTDQAGQGRYRFHDLLRVFARERANEIDPLADRKAALGRAFGAWLGLAVRAEAGLPCRFLKVRLAAGRLPPLEPGVVGRLLADPLAWLDAERDALVAVAGQALALGLPTLACDVAGALTTLFDLRSHYDLWKQTQERTLAAAEDQRSRAILHQGLGALAFYRDRYDEASEHFTRAQGIFAALGEQRGHAYANLGLGSVRLFHGENDEAAAELTQARDAFARCEDASGTAFALQALGIVHRNQGDLDTAARCLDQALAIFRRLGSRYGEACVLFSLGLHYQARGDLAATERTLAEAVELFRAASCPRDEALALHVLAATCAEQGDADRASRLMSQSLTVFSPADESVDKACSLYSHGWVAHRNQRLDEAAACFDRASRLFERLGMPRQHATTVSAVHRLGLSVPRR